MVIYSIVFFVFGPVLMVFIILNYYIYKITNTVTNKIYIGQTNNPTQRWAQYRSAMKQTLPSQLISRSMKKHGEDKFLFEVILTCRTLDDVNHQETYVIAQYDATNKEIGYNIDYGGGSTVRNPEIGIKIGISNKGRVSPRKGVTLTEETKNRMSESAMGKAGTNTGKTFDDEWRANQSSVKAGKPQNHRRKFTDEQELQISKEYADGASSTTLSKLYNVPTSSILAVLERTKTTIRPGNGGKRKPALSQDQESALCADYKTKKFSRSALAIKYGIGKTTARDVLIRNNIPLGDDNGS